MLPISASYPQSQTKYEWLLDNLADGIDSDNEYADAPIWQPSPENEPQRMAYELAKSGAVMQMGYGGQAGGGKTDLALGLAGTVFNDAIIFRREYPQLSKIIERGDTLFPSRFISGDKKSWRFNGHNIRLASVQHEKDWTKYQGQATPLIAFDEAAQFTEKQIRFISGWQRTVEENKHTLLLLCFNPPTTPEGEWIIQMFAPWIAPDYAGKRAKSGEIRWFVNIDGNEMEADNGDAVYHDGKPLYPISRTFIAASRHDNPYLELDYERVLSNLPEPLRTMLMDGDFTLSTQDNKWQVMPTNWILAAQERHRNGEKPVVKLRTVGVDVAHGGDDNTVISKLYQNWFDDLIVYSGGETPTGAIAAHLVIKAMEDIRAPIFVDGIGYGSSCADDLKEMPGVKATAVNVGVGSNATDKSGVYQFVNLRSQIFWQLREALDPDGNENIALPDDRMLRVELSAMRYTIVGGKIKVESKQDIIKRLGHSPDMADAIALAWYGTISGIQSGPIVIDGWSTYRG